MQYLGPHRCHQRAGAEDVDQARQVVSQDVQRHFSSDSRECLHQEVSCTHTRLDRAEGVLHRLAPLAHPLRVLVEPPLDRLKNMLMLPALNPSFPARGAAVLDGAAQACVGPVTSQGQPLLLVRVSVRQSLTGRADVDVVLRDIAEVLFDEPTFGLVLPEVSGLGSVTVIPAFSQANISSLLKYPRSATTSRPPNSPRTASSASAFPLGVRQAPYASGHPAGGGNLGFIASTDGGKSWTRRSDGVGGPVDFHQMDVSKADPQVIIGAYRGLQISRNGGHSWETAGPLPQRTLDLAASAIRRAIRTPFPLRDQPPSGVRVEC